MTTADEPEENLVDNLFREVDDHFADLERQYKAARAELTSVDPARPESERNFVRSSTERFELVSQVASLTAEVSRSTEALADRDELLKELETRIQGFEAQIEIGDKAIRAERQTRQELLEATREISRLNALLEARAAERREMNELVHRMQLEKEHVEELLSTALARFEDVDSVRAEVTDKLAALEAARQGEALEHQAKAAQLAEAKREVKRLTANIEELTKVRDDAEQRAVKFEGLVERRSSEVKFLNRRIQTLTDEAARSASLDSELNELRRENTLLQRKITELERKVASQTAEAAASAKAVETLVERSSERDEFAARAAELESRLSRQDAAVATAAEQRVTEVMSTTADQISRLTSRIRELEQSQTTVADAATAPGLTPGVAQVNKPVDETATSNEDDEVQSSLGGRSDDHNPSSRGQDAAASRPAFLDQAPLGSGLETSGNPAPERSRPHNVRPESLSPPDATSQKVPSPIAGVSVSPEAPPPPAPRIDYGQIHIPRAEAGSRSARSESSVPRFDLFGDDEHVSPGKEGERAQAAASRPAPDLSTVMAEKERSRVPLPENVEPDTAEAAEYLLGQVGISVIVDARSCCSQTGLRPTELFRRLAAELQRFDTTADVVITPVSTPIGELPSDNLLRVHHVGGSDTVADRTRSLAQGLPSDQLLVVVSADDHVRRAGVTHGANVLAPEALFRDR